MNPLFLFQQGGMHAGRKIQAFLLCFSKIEARFGGSGQKTENLSYLGSYFNSNCCDTQASDVEIERRGAARRNGVWNRP